MASTYGKDYRLPKKIIRMDVKRTEKKRWIEINLDTASSSNNERTRIEGWGLGSQTWMESSNKFLQWVKEDVQGTEKPGNKSIKTN